MPRSFNLLLSVVALNLASFGLFAADPKPEPKGIELFNGKDLTGWGYKTGEKFDGKTESDDQRFSGEGRRHRRPPRQRDQAVVDDGDVPEGLRIAAGIPGGG